MSNRVFKKIAIVMIEINNSNSNDRRKPRNVKIQAYNKMLLERKSMKSCIDKRIRHLYNNS